MLLYQDSPAQKPIRSPKLNDELDAALLNFKDKLKALGIDFEAGYFFSSAVKLRKTELAPWLSDDIVVYSNPAKSAVLARKNPSKNEDYIVVSATREKLVAFLESKRGQELLAKMPDAAKAKEFLSALFRSPVFHEQDVPGAKVSETVLTYVPGSGSPDLIRIAIPGTKEQEFEVDSAEKWKTFKEFTDGIIVAKSLPIAAKE